MVFLILLFFSFILIILGGLWLCLWQQRWRIWGLFPIILGIFGAGWQQPPHLLIDGRGKLVGIYDKKTLYVSSTRKGKFTAEIWKHYVAAQETKPLNCKKGVCKTFLKNIPIIISHDKDYQPCEKGAILIRLEPSKLSCPTSRITLDWYDLWRNGAHALWIGALGIHVKKVATIQGKRPWTRQAISRKERPNKVPSPFPEKP